MKRIVNSEEMKHCDSSTITYFKVPSLVLMERAALSIAEAVMQEIKKGGRILTVCGNGNNGADGLAAARLLYQKGFCVTAVQMPDNGRRTEENRRQREILEKYGIRVLDDIPKDQAYDGIIDALFGIGLSRAPKDMYAAWIRLMNQLDGFKIAADMPSGVSSDTGEAYEPCFRADKTVTFAYFKAGQILYPGCEMCGNVTVSDIGITDESWLDKVPSCYAYEKKDLKKLPKRPSRSNKGTFGRVLAIAGSRNMAGAAVFCAQAAYCMGCGLVKIYTPEENRVILQNAVPQAILETYSTRAYEAESVSTGREPFAASADERKLTDFPDEKQLADVLAWADVIVMGPGLGTGSFARQLVKEVLHKAKVPLILDADALNITAMQPELLLQTSAELAVTPHLGEMSRLCRKPAAKIQNSMRKTASDFAKEHHVICVLKDAITVTADETDVFFNTSGCSALAKAGSGDILAGMIAALAASGMPLKEAAPFGVYIHGLAGEKAAAVKGEYSVLAEDILNATGSVLMS